MSAAEVQFEVKKLRLRHAWQTTMSASTYRETIHVRFQREGLTGYGEGAPILRYGESASLAEQALTGVIDLLEHADPWRYEPLLEEVKQLLGPAQRAALAAVDLALHDWLGKKLGIPLFRWLGLDPETAPRTSFSIGIDTPERTREKVLEAAAYPILKIKLGLENDEETLAAVRAVTSKPLRVDANEGWTDVEQAIRKIRWLEEQGVELVEQPMPAAMLEETRYVRSKVNMPIYADEACTSSSAMAALRGAYDGVNVKLDKAGGIAEARRWIATARALDLKVMLGCMVSSSCSTTAAAHLAGLADVCDLDGNLLLAEDPFRGMTVVAGHMIVPAGNGLGVTPVEEVQLVR